MPEIVLAGRSHVVFKGGCTVRKVKLDLQKTKKEKER